MYEFDTKIEKSKYIVAAPTFAKIMIHLLFNIDFSLLMSSFITHIFITQYKKLKIKFNVYFLHNTQSMIIFLARENPPN